MPQKKQPPDFTPVQDELPVPADADTAIEALVRRNEAARQRNDELEKQLKKLEAEQESRET